MPLWSRCHVNNLECFDLFTFAVTSAPVAARPAQDLQKSKSKAAAQTAVVPVTKTVVLASFQQTFAHLARAAVRNKFLLVVSWCLSVQKLKNQGSEIGKNVLKRSTEVTTVYSHTSRQFSAEFRRRSFGVGLYAGHATQPCFNSQSQHGMDH